MTIAYDLPEWVLDELSNAREIELIRWAAARHAEVERARTAERVQFQVAVAFKEERDAAEARVVEAERALREARATCDGSCDIALASQQVGPDGRVPGNAKECAHFWRDEADRLRREATEDRNRLADSRDAALSRALAAEAEAKFWKERNRYARATILVTKNRMLRAENERLREALRGLRLHAPWVDGLDCWCVTSDMPADDPAAAEPKRSHEDACNAARAALKETR